MYSLIARSVDRRIEAATLIASFVVAELFYKFHSFTLECGAFLVTWAFSSALAHALARAAGAKGAADAAPAGRSKDERR